MEGHGSVMMEAEPTWAWRAGIKEKKGQVGWTNEMRNFDHIYSCGD